jgi:hypothetical protein
VYLSDWRKLSTRIALLRRLFQRALVICCASWAFGLAPPQVQEKPIETTVCQLVSGCSAFNGKRVRFRASVESDWFEHTALVDQKCDRGVVPETSEEADKRPDVTAFNRAMAQGKPGTTDLHINAIFTGRFFCRQPSIGSQARRIIEIDKLDSLEVTRTKIGP